GHADAADLLLIGTAEKALAAGVAAAVPGARIGDISAAIGAVAHAAGYGIPAGFGGHGIGRRMHEDPHVPNDGRPGRGMRLRPGLVLALEPMVMAGGGGRGPGWRSRGSPVPAAAVRRARPPRRPGAAHAARE